MIAIKQVHKGGEVYQQMDGVLAKVVAAFGPSEIVALLKAVALAESEIHTIIHALAQRQRCSDESPAQAFTKFITLDPDGIELYQILKSMQGNKIKSLDASRCNGSHFGNLVTLGGF